MNVYLCCQIEIYRYYESSCSERHLSLSHTHTVSFFPRRDRLKREYTWMQKIISLHTALTANCRLNYIVLMNHTISCRVAPAIAPNFPDRIKFSKQDRKPTIPRSHRDSASILRRLSSIGDHHPCILRCSMSSTDQPAHQEDHTALSQSTPTQSGIERKVDFSNDTGEKLVGLYLDVGRDDVVILCHGYMANKDMAQFPALAQGLGVAGFDVLRFDHPCAYSGESERRGPFVMGNHDEEVADMVAAVTFVRSTLGKRVLCIVGHSKGGTNVMQYAATVGDVPCIVNLAGRFRVREGTLKRFGEDIFEKLAAAGPKGILRKETSGFEWTMTLEDFERRSNRPMEEYARAIKEKGNVEILCLHGRDDKTIPWQESEECANLSGAEIAVIDGDHNFRDAASSAQMVEQIVQFCTKNRQFLNA